MKTADEPTIFRISGGVKHFAWGKRDGLAHRLRLEESGQKEAELWIGAHPLQSARFYKSAACPWEDLLQWQEASGSRLSYMLKILAVDRALSIQVHPNKHEAEVGYAAEESAHVPLTDPKRNFRDRFAKPELILALDSDFTALCDFRPLCESKEFFAVLVETAQKHGLPSQHLTRFVHKLEELAAGAKHTELVDIEHFLAGLLETTKTSHALATECVCAFQTLAKECAHTKWAENAQILYEIAQQFPSDTTIVLAAMLRCHRLSRGEALWLPPGTVHAYVSGYGVEIMGPSDNVLRGGLTEKHIDSPAFGKTVAPALLKTVLTDSETQAAQTLQPQTAGNAEVFRPVFTPQDGTEFTLIRCVGASELENTRESCVIATDGTFELFDPENGQRERLCAGESAFVLAERISVNGEGQLFVASRNARVHTGRAQ